jgi:hypothetical protein
MNGANMFKYLHGAELIVAHVVKEITSILWKSKFHNSASLVPVQNQIGTV